MKVGIAPSLLVSQVEGTAEWLKDDPRAAAVNAVLAGARALEPAWRAAPEGEENQLAYFRLLLAAHFSTVATFVPTDVDARIRHHAWVAAEGTAVIARACDIVDEVAEWDPSWVSARVVESPSGALSGHDGEWLAVRAGALGRAAALSATAVVERLVEVLDREIDRHERIFREAYEGGAPAQRVLSIATVVAHNLGDLSRVVEAWPGGADTLPALRAKYSKLGHPAAAPTARRRSFVTCGELNKSMMALENHRFLALRKPRALRSARALLLPIGPWFDTWGECVATHEALEARDRAEVVTALLELHTTSPDQLGCLRALAGIHAKTRGGLEVYVPDLPARLRKDATRGRVREAVDLGEERFVARLERRFRTERERLGPGKP